MSTWPRIIVHADMDAFYAAVEQLDNPELRGKPILIGPNSHRGVVLTASYEARPYRVGSGMPVAEARRRCPQAIMIPPRFARYQEVSAQVMAVFDDFSPQVEALSLDEAFLDLSGAGHIFGSPEIIGRKIKDAVKAATQLDISVGIAGTKYVAKVASAHDKPDGLTVVPEEAAVSWLAPLPITRLWGCGDKTARRMVDLGLLTIGDVARADLRFLVQHLGATGSHFHELANARDPRPVRRGREARSIGSDRTLDRDITDRAEILVHLRRSAERIARRIRAKGWVAGGIRVRLKTAGFAMLTRQRHLHDASDTAECYLAVAEQLLSSFDHPGPFRLVGMAAFDLRWRTEPEQLDLFADHSPRNLETTIDRLIDRFGTDVVQRARDLLPAGTVSQSGTHLDFPDPPAAKDQPANSGGKRPPTAATPP
jgi:DNA polymerase IV